VTSKYLEHLVSQKKFDETAAACAKLLKVPFIITRQSQSMPHALLARCLLPGCSTPFHFRRMIARSRSSAHSACLGTSQGC
jgi:hypothetical protein